jgi:uncharacterized protein
MSNIKKISLGIGAFLFYFIIHDFVTLPFNILNIDFIKLPLLIRTIYFMVFDIFVITILFLIFKKEIISNFKDLKKNHKEYFEEYLKYWFLVLGLMIISNIFIGFFTDSIASNQDAINELFTKNPIYIIFSAVLIAPIAEELIFRLSLRYIIKNDWVYIIVSGLSFGLIHILSAESFMSELIYLIPYAIPGLIFAYVHTKSKNIFVPIGLHFIHNGFLISLKVFTSIFGW